MGLGKPSFWEEISCWEFILSTPITAVYDECGLWSTQIVPWVESVFGCKSLDDVVKAEKFWKSV